MVENDEDQTNFELHSGADRTDAVGSDPQTGAAAQRTLVVGRRGEAQAVIMSVGGTSRLSAKAIQTEIKRHRRQRRVKNA